MTSLLIFSAFFLDFFFGDPLWFPHPVRGMGWLIQRTEAFLRPLARSAGAEKAAGIFLVLLVVFSAYLISALVVYFAWSFSHPFGFLIAVLIAYTSLAARDLSDSAGKVLASLEKGDMVGARNALSMIVGRDTKVLDEQQVSRALIETVSENTSDGVIAPLFYLALGGPALAMAYKAVNTLDSMVGYKNTKYRNFGWAAARLDDVANYLPARIAALLLSLAAWCLPGASGIKAFRIVIRDGHRHASPNSGYPEAAVAGALGLCLGGPSTYAGQVCHKPYIGVERGDCDRIAVEKSVQLMYCATVFGVLISAYLAAFTR